MPAPDVAAAIAVLAVLAAIVLLHAGQLARMRRTDGQMTFGLTPLPEVDRGPANALIAAVARAVREDDAAPGQRLRFSRAAEIADRLIAEDVVFERDLTLRGSVVARAPLKVQGDLSIEGHAVFHEPVVVDGFVIVSGQAIFHAGLLAKSDLISTGKTFFGAAESTVWAVTGRKAFAVVPAAGAAADGSRIVHLPERAVA